MTDTNSFTTPDDSRRPDKESDRWFTPDAMVRRIERLLDLEFTLDPCACEESAKAPTYFTYADDGLAHDWTQAAGRGSVWCNPPCSNPGPWLEKAAATAAAGTPVVALVRASTDTNWWQHCDTAAVVYTLHGRVPFERPGGESPRPADHASLLVVWRPGYDGPTVLYNLETKELCQPLHDDCVEAPHDPCPACATTEPSRWSDNDRATWCDDCRDRMDVWQCESCDQPAGAPERLPTVHVDKYFAWCDWCDGCREGCYADKYDPTHPPTLLHDGHQRFTAYDLQPDIDGPTAATIRSAVEACDRIRPPGEDIALPSCNATYDPPTAAKAFEDDVRAVKAVLGLDSAVPPTTTPMVNAFLHDLAHVAALPTDVAQGQLPDAALALRAVVAAAKEAAERHPSP